MIKLLGKNNDLRMAISTLSGGDSFFSTAERHISGHIDDGGHYGTKKSAYLFI